jgi:hypothetical protein
MVVVPSTNRRSAGKNLLSPSAAANNGMLMLESSKRSMAANERKASCCRTTQGVVAAVEGRKSGLQNDASRLQRLQGPLQSKLLVSSHLSARRGWEFLIRERLGWHKKDECSSEPHEPSPPIFYNASKIHQPNTKSLSFKIPLFLQTNRI